jgi:DNA-binding transcriptional regulator YiaG
MTVTSVSEIQVTILKALPGRDALPIPVAVIFERLGIHQPLHVHRASVSRSLARLAARGLAQRLNPEICRQGKGFLWRRGREVEEEEMTFTAEHIKTARRLLGWSQVALAVRAGVGINQLRNFESGLTVPQVSTLTALRNALDAAGVEFIAKNGGGVGVN